MTEDGNFQHEGTSILQCQCGDNPADGCFQEGTRSMFDPEG